MNESVMHGLFPTPVLYSTTNREFTKKELDFVKKTYKNVDKNEGNLVSKNRYILNEPAMAKIKSEIETAIQEFMDKVISAKPDVKAVITQSWLNYTAENEYHHKHEHPNSFISGVYYIDADETNDKIFFVKGGYQQIQIDPVDWNIWNSKSWWLSVKSGNIVVFPSHLTHFVEQKKGDNVRCSLSFNTFLKGNIGEDIALTALNI